MKLIVLCFLILGFSSCVHAQVPEIYSIKNDCEVQINDSTLLEKIKDFDITYDEYKPYFLTLNQEYRNDTLSFYLTFSFDSTEVSSGTRYTFVNDQLLLISSNNKNESNTCVTEIYKLISNLGLREFIVYRSSGYILKYYKGKYVGKLCWHKSSPEHAEGCGH